MKVLGLSCGRKLGNSEVLVKEALMGAQEQGCEVEIIRLLDLKVKPCTGCESCRMAEIKKGGEEAICIEKNDDMPFLIEKLLECDACIVGAPAYHLMPPGWLTTIGNRMAIIGTRFKHKPRYSANIAVGGSDWLALILPIMSIFLPHDFKLVDQMEVALSPRTGQIVLNDEALARARNIGREIAQAIKNSPDKVKYLGKVDPCSCPLCHQNLVVVHEKYAECPLCGTKGRLEMAHGEIKVVFDEQSRLGDRWSPQQMKEHVALVERGHKMYEERKQEVSEKLKKYKEFLPYTQPPSLKGSAKD